jgi:hypothetical protein
MFQGSRPRTALLEHCPAYLFRCRNVKQFSAGYYVALKPRRENNHKDIYNHITCKLSPLSLLNYRRKRGPRLGSYSFALLCDGEPAKIGRFL